MKLKKLNIKMDQTNEVSEVKENNLGKFLPMAFILLVVIGVVLMAKKPEDREMMEIGGDDKSVAQATITPTVMAANYKDGVYQVQGNYVSPGGEETIGVKVTLKNNVISEAEVTPEATLDKSKFFQAKFVSGYKEMVVGKNINEVKLDKVSGSSLTPKGFNDAIEKIKGEAKV